MAVVLVTVLGLYAIVDSLSIGLGAEQRVAYGALICCTGLVLCMTKRRTVCARRLGWIAFSWCAVASIGLVMAVCQETMYTSYVLGDAISFIFPVLLMTIAMRDATAFYENRSIIILGTLMMIASVGAVFAFRTMGHVTDRFAEPPLFLMALGWIGIVRPTKPWVLLASAIVSVAVLQLTVMSGARFALVLWAAMGVVLFMFGHVSKRTALFAICSPVALLFAGSLLFDSVDINRKVEASRVGQWLTRLDADSVLESIADDSSMQNRMCEAGDVLHTRFEYQPMTQWIFGSGHGATFDASFAYYGDRLLASGEAHHIHFGLVLLYYRYGIPGVLGFIWLFAAAARQLWLLRRCPKNSPIYYPSLLFTLACLAYLLNFMLFNELVDPIFSYALAGFVVTRDLSGVAVRRAHPKRFVRQPRHAPRVPPVAGVRRPKPIRPVGPSAATDHLPARAPKGPSTSPADLNGPPYRQFQLPMRENR